MTSYAYDGSFEGWLSVVFAAYQAGETPSSIVAGAGQAGLFGLAETVPADAAHADRVARGIARRGSPALLDTVYHAFQSDQPDRERVLYRFVSTLFRDGPAGLDDWRDPDVRAVERMERLTRREVHRMHAFVRFEALAEGGFEAVIEPEADVLPLIGDHFAARYPGFDWRIRDVRRRRALAHTADETKSAEDRLAIVPAEGPGLQGPDRQDGEAHVQKMWQAYFRSVTIPERKNLKLHTQHMPRRYWRHLPEKRPEIPGRAA